jgi:hypothetical protein
MKKTNEKTQKNKQKNPGKQCMVSRSIELFVEKD